ACAAARNPPTAKEHPAACDKADRPAWRRANRRSAPRSPARAAQAGAAAASRTTALFSISRQTSRLNRPTDSCQLFLRLERFQRHERAVSTLVPLMGVPAARVLTAALLARRDAGQALFTRQHLRRIIERQMRERGDEHFAELDLQLLRARRRNDRVELVEDRVFLRIVPARDVFRRKLVFRRRNVLAVEALLPFFHGHVVRADV